MGPENAVVAGGQTIVKAGQSTEWSPASPRQANLQFNELVPLTVQQILGSRASLRDNGEARIGTVGLYRYQLRPDPATLVSLLDASRPFKDPAAQTAIRQALTHGHLQFEVWIGKDDLKVRRLVTDGQLLVDASALLGPPANDLPQGPGASVLVGEHLIVDLYDFDVVHAIATPGSS